MASGKWVGNADFRRSLRQTLLIINALLPSRFWQACKQKRAGMARPSLQQGRFLYRL